eukprot:jgi/Tetstr1/463070/TSEL_008005.t1
MPRGLFPIVLDGVLEYLVSNPRLQLAEDEYCHAACYGTFIAGVAVELRKLLEAAFVTDGITPAFGQRLEAISCGSATSAPAMKTWGSPEFTELLELCKDRVYDANITSAAHQRFGGAFRCNDRERDGSGSSRENFKTTRPWRGTVAPRATFAKDATKNSDKGMAKAEVLTVDKAE